MVCFAFWNNEHLLNLQEITSSTSSANTQCLASPQRFRPNHFVIVLWFHCCLLRFVCLAASHMSPEIVFLGIRIHLHVVLVGRWSSLKILIDFPRCFPRLLFVVFIFPTKRIQISKVGDSWIWSQNSPTAYNWITLTITKDVFWEIDIDKLGRHCLQPTVCRGTCITVLSGDIPRFVFRTRTS